MKRGELKIALRAAATLARENEFYVVGTQALHAYCSKPPAEVLVSQECDLYPKYRPQSALLLDSQLGRVSPFARKHGFYVDVVTPEIATLPTGWESRLKPFRVGKITAWCLEVHDLIISKLAAGRLKDLEFVGALVALGIVNRAVLRRRIRRLPSKQDRSLVRLSLKLVLDDISK